MMFAFGLVCLVLADTVFADDSCRACNTVLRQCKRPCKIYDSLLRKDECMLPCYSRGVLCLNICKRTGTFSTSDLDAEDTSTL